MENINKHITKTQKSPSALELRQAEIDERSKKGYDRWKELSSVATQKGIELHENMLLAAGNKNYIEQLEQLESIRKQFIATEQCINRHKHVGFTPDLILRHRKTGVFKQVNFENGKVIISDLFTKKNGSRKH